MSEEIEQYKKTIAWLMDQQSAIVVGNKTEEHAAALYELFFDRAKKEVLIFCKNLKKEVFDVPTVIAAAKKALDRGVSIKIILQNKEDGDFLKLMGNCLSLKLKRARPEDAAAQFNFSVKDAEAYRFERKNTTIEATAKMYHLDESTKLKNLFDVMWKLGPAETKLSA